MSTHLYAISNIKSNKEEILKYKDFILWQLNALDIGLIKYYDKDTPNPKSPDWEYGFPMVYDEQTDTFYPDIENEEIIYFNSNTIFNVTIYSNSLVLSTIYKYRFLYEVEPVLENYLLKFRKDIFNVVSIFGGTEIIYLADNSCNKLGTYLECQVWEGVSYLDVKKQIFDSKIPIVTDYNQLKYDNLDYSNIIEVVMDYFEDLK